MAEAAGEISKAPAITNFACWFGSICGLVVIALLVAGDWPSAVGVVIAVIPLLWMTSQFRKTFRRTQAQRSRSAGARTMAVINGTGAVIILFAGALIGGDLILVSSAFFGTWMIGISTILIAAAGSGPGTNSDEKFAPKT